MKLTQIVASIALFLSITTEANILPHIPEQTALRIGIKNMGQ